MTKKYIYILFIWLFILSAILNYKEEVKIAFNNIEYKYDKYQINFKECELNTNDFIQKLSLLKDKDFKILEIIPYTNESNLNNFKNIKFLFYSDDFNYVLNSFKEKYNKIMIDNSLYVSNICIKNIILYTNNEYLNNFNYNSTK